MAEFNNYHGRIYLLAGKVDGSGVWDVTPEGIDIPFPGISCANDYVTINASRTTLNLYKIRH
ncbi:MAG: hypothetical protein M5U34_12985 [Chloroflexi bacterium]|nr:hypothetical protein [Chloroflexota bacterium]